MEDDEKKDYRLHLINTIDNAIDNGISVYDLDVVNKKAIRHNYINKQVVIDKVNEINKKYEDSKDENGESPYYYPDFTIRILQELLEGERK